MSVYPFVDVDQFTPNSRINWISVGKIASVHRERNRFTLEMPNGLYVVYSVISKSSYRIWFSPKKGTDFLPKIPASPLPIVQTSTSASSKMMPIHFRSIRETSEWILT